MIFDLGDRVQIREDGYAGSAREFLGREGEVIDDPDECFSPEYTYVRLDNPVDGRHRWWVPTSDLLHTIAKEPQWEL